MRHPPQEVQEASTSKDQAMTPIGNRVFVKLSDSINTPIPGFVIPPKTDAWSGQSGAVYSENRGLVAAIGLDVDAEQIKPGDVVRFSEIVYPTVIVDGQKYTVITDMDIVGVEEEGSFEVA
jgi:co-chaperonin GroES (HSP10)